MRAGTRTKTARPAYPGATRSAARLILDRIALLVGALIIWEALADWLIDPLWIGQPSLVAARLWQLAASGDLSRHAWTTLLEAGLGLLLAFAVGVPIGILMARFKYGAAVAEPYVMALYSMPRVALAPLFIIWFGIDLQMKVLLAAVTVFFLVYLNTAAGVRSVDRGLVDAVRLMGGNHREVITKVLLPGSMAGVITGLRVAVPYALIGAVVGELVASNRGLGYLMLDSASQFNTAGVFAALVVITLIATVLNLGVNALDRRSSRWKPVDE